MIHRSSLSVRTASFRPVGKKVLVRRHERPGEIGGIVMPRIAAHIGLAAFDVVETGPQCDVLRKGDVAYAPSQLQFGRMEVGGEALEVGPEELFVSYSRPNDTPDTSPKLQHVKAHLCPEGDEVTVKFDDGGSCSVTIAPFSSLRTVHRKLSELAAAVGHRIETGKW